MRWVALSLAAALLVGAASIPAREQPKSSANQALAPAQPKADAEPGPTAYEQESLAVDRAANSIAENANAISKAQRNYAFWQLVLGGFGVAFTAVAAVAAIAAARYAKAAAEAARDSADADSAALSETRQAAEEARKAAVDQARRAAEQLALADQTMQFTAKTAYAMSDSARETRRVATAMREGAEASKESADAAKRHADAIEKQLSVVERAYIYASASPEKVEVMKQRTVKLSLHVANHGNTPGRIREIRFGVVKPGPNGDIILPSEPDYSGANLIRTDIVFAAGDKGPVYEIEAPIEAVAYSEIIYEDVFQTRHVSRACLKYNAVKMQIGTVGGEAWNHCD